MITVHPTTVKEFVIGFAPVDICSPFDLGVMDAEEGLRMQPDAYFAQYAQRREYRAGYTHAMNEMADVAYPESQPVYNAYGDIVR